MSSDLLVDLHDELGGDDSPSAALDQLKLVPEKQWPQDDPVSVSKSGECSHCFKRSCLKNFFFHGCHVFMHYGPAADHSSVTVSITCNSDPKSEDSVLLCVVCLVVGLHVLKLRAKLSVLVI